MSSSISLPRQPRRLSIPAWLILLIILSAMATIIWSTFGLKTTSLYEDWNFYNLFSGGVSPLDPSVFGQHGRFFLEFWIWLGYALAPNSFIGLNLYMIVLFFIQGIAVFMLIRRLRPQNPAFAVAVAVLAAIYPADNSLANMRYASYHTAIIFFLFSVSFLIAYWQQPRRIFLIGMIATNILNLGIIEVSYPLVLILPLLLVWLDPERRITRRVVRVALFWYIGPTIMLIDSLVLFMNQRDSYQVALLATSQHEPLIAHLSGAIQALVHAYARVFIEGWSTATQQIDPYSGRLIGGLLIAALCAVGLWVVNRRQLADHGLLLPARINRSTATIDNNRPWFIIGLLVIGLGFAIYAYLPTHQYYTERVYLLAGLGGALVIPIILSWIGRLFKREKVFVTVSLAVLIGLGLQGDLVDVKREATVSEQEQSLLAQIVEQVPTLDKVRLLVIFDPTHQFSTSMIFAMRPYPDVFAPALNYLYQTAAGFEVRICVPDVDPTVFVRLGCILSKDQIAFTNGTPVADQRYALDQVVAFEYYGDNQVRLLTTWPIAGGTTYRPDQLIDRQAPVPARTYSILSHWPFQLQTPLNEHPVQTVSFNQSSLVMLLDQPTLPYINYGWIGNWTSSTRSTVEVWLSADHDYQLKVLITQSTLPETLKHITLAVNDEPVTLIAQTNTDQSLTLTASIGHDIIARDLTKTRITFLSYPLTSPLAAGTGTGDQFMGFKVDQFNIAPVDH